MSGLLEVLLLTSAEPAKGAALLSAGVPATRVRDRLTSFDECCEETEESNGAGQDIEESHLGDDGRGEKCVPPSLAFAACFSSPPEKWLIEKSAEWAGIYLCGFDNRSGTYLTPTGRCS
jgi:hypothetical protein